MYVWCVCVCMCVHECMCVYVSVCGCMCGVNEKSAIDTSLLLTHQPLSPQNTGVKDDIPQYLRAVPTQCMQ